MARDDFRSVEDYIGFQPKTVQSILESVREAIGEAIPGAEEVISYKMPAYTLHGELVLCVAAWKKHYSIYGATEAVVAEFGEELAPYEIQKGTIRFPLSEPAPVKLIGRIAEFRAREIVQRSPR